MFRSGFVEGSNVKILNKLQSTALAPYACCAQTKHCHTVWTHSHFIDAWIRLKYTYCILRTNITFITGSLVDSLKHNITYLLVKSLQSIQAYL
jgi:hypothetical protein